jgi:hypothetical protein
MRKAAVHFMNALLISKNWENLNAMPDFILISQQRCVIGPEVLTALMLKLNNAIKCIAL